MKDAGRERDDVTDVDHVSGCLVVVVRGDLERATDVQRLAERLERRRIETSCSLVLLDAREQSALPPPSHPSWDALWGWLSSADLGFEGIAFVLANEPSVTRIDMTAIAVGAPVRAFLTREGARRWLMRWRRSTVSSRMRARRDTVPGKPQGVARPPHARRSDAAASPGFRAPSRAEAVDSPFDD